MTASVSHNSTLSDSPPTESTYYRDARADARNCLTLDELSDAMARASIDAEDLDEYVRFTGREHLRAFEEEYERRIRIISVPGSRAAQYNRDYEQWAQLAATVRERISVPELLHMIGCYISPTGINGKTGETEYHSDCPACRDGTDRLVSWDGPNSRCWCRRCDWRADAIAVARSFLPGCETFRKAVRTLSDLAALNQAVR